MRPLQTLMMSLFIGCGETPKTADEVTCGENTTLVGGECVADEADADTDTDTDSDTDTDTIFASRRRGPRSIVAVGRQLDGSDWE